jgi:hypothetical protein
VGGSVSVSLRHGLDAEQAVATIHSPQALVGEGWTILGAVPSYEEQPNSFFWLTAGHQVGIWKRSKEMWYKNNSLVWLLHFVRFPFHFANAGNRWKLVISALLFSLTISQVSVLMASDRVDCDATSEMWDDVEAGGYSFRAYSNIAESPDGKSCMQWIIRNDPEKTRVRIDWYFPTSSETVSIFGPTTVVGCYDTPDCDCDSTPCQVVAETSPMHASPIPVETTIDFGRYLRDEAQSSAEQSDPHVRGRILPKLSTEWPVYGGAEHMPSEGRTPQVTPLPRDWDFTTIQTHIGGFPGTQEGEAISLDMTFFSYVHQETPSQYFIYNQIVDNSEESNDIFLAKYEDVNSGEIELPENGVAVSWTALESPESNELYPEPLSLVSLDESVGISSESLVPRGIGMSQDTKVTMYYKGEFILEVRVSAYLPLEE